jgi:hypothetical protein
MNAKISELADRLETLNEQETAGLRELILGEFERLDGDEGTDENTRALAALAAVADKFMAPTGRKTGAKLREGVTASGGHASAVATLAARRPARSPEAAPAEERAVLVASAAMRGIEPGKPLQRVSRCLPYSSSPTALRASLLTRYSRICVTFPVRSR